MDFFEVTMENITIYSKENRIDTQLFNQMFALLEQSFPTSERRNYAGHLAEFSAPQFHSICYIPDKLQGFLNYWDFGDFIYIEHFAVQPQLRGQGTGSRIMEHLRSVAGDKLMVLEAEPPSDSEIAARRVVFYNRLGFELNSYNYIQPAMMEGEQPIPLVIMSTPRGLTESEYIYIRDTMYREVYRQ